ncbi:hypothetical protein BDZ97DRAFT_1866296 [Flammula alnicola]|nr:hypothetical protein BDZ97DRAFT_1866296 [Flammula alnicola]
MKNSPNLSSASPLPSILSLTGIPSVSRPRGSASFAVPSQTKDDNTGTGVSAGAVGSLKKTAYHSSSRGASASSAQAQLDINSDRRARGLDSPPIVDFTQFEDTYRGPRNGQRTTKSGMRSSSSGVKPVPKRSVPLSMGGTQSSATGISPLPASNIDGYLNAHELLAMHQLDQVEFEDRDRVRAGLVKHGKIDVPGRKGVLGVNLLLRNDDLGGREHELPIIVVNSVEELYRTGIYQPNLFRTLPNRSRLLELVEIYDSAQQPPGTMRVQSHTQRGFGSDTSLHLESTPDICALLTMYLSSLPEPILTPLLFRPIWDCQVALVREDNGVGVEDLSRMFGGRIFGGGSITDDMFNTTQTRREGETMMAWFLRRWAPLSEGLFDVVEDAKMGIFRRPLAPEKDLVSRTTASGDLAPLERATTPHSSEERTPLPRIHRDGIPFHSTPKSCLKTKGAENPSSGSHDIDEMDGIEYVILRPNSGDVPDETLDITQIPMRVDNSSVSSTPALDERLLDVSMPTLLNQTLPIRMSEGEGTYPTAPSIFISRETQTLATNPSELAHALKLTALLESQLDERTHSLTEALEELTQSKIKCSKLQDHVHELEVQLSEYHNGVSSGSHNALAVYEQKLEATKKERDDAQDIVRGIKKLIVET